MTDTIFIIIGGIVGLLAGFAFTEKSVTLRLESIAVGMFGAGMGVLVFGSMAAPGANAVSVGSIVASIAGAIAGIFVLKVFRKAVGPLRAGKSRHRAR